MSTKAVGSNARNDVTLEYKYKENSEQERASHGADQSGLSSSHIYFNYKIFLHVLSFILRLTIFAR